MIDTGTTAAPASPACDMSMRGRAARHWAGVMAGAFGNKDLASGLLDEGPQLADGTQAQTPCAEASARRRKPS